MVNYAVYAAPELTDEDARVIAEIHNFRERLADVLRVPKRWTGGLRRTTQARAIQGSNTIEGYAVSTMDAVAAVDFDEPLAADDKTWAEIVAYRRVMTYVLGMVPDPEFRLDTQTLRSMHFMLLEHDLSKTPGRFRTGPIWVRSNRGDTVYEGPEDELVPGLVDQLTQTIRNDGHDPMVDAALAHLNLVMIHPFRDGNGRMSRALQTLVMAQDEVLEPTFSSVEEWLGANTEDYYAVLAATGHGSWNPQNDTSLWVRFNLRAHHMQAQTLRRRFYEAELTWLHLDEIARERALPDRVLDALFDALLGARVSRKTYMKRTDVNERLASRDLLRLADAELLEPRGRTGGRHYLIGEKLRKVQNEVRIARQPLEDPYPGLMREIRLAL